MIGAAALDTLVGHAAEWTGFSRDAILPETVRRASAGLLAEARTVDELLRRAASRDALIVHALCQAVSVGETFFFRQPEHFRFIAERLLPELVARGQRSVRAWSAGCATGEEAYSLAACLLDRGPGGTQVLGTDLLERNLVVARAGTYGSWSQRPSGPLLHPAFREAALGKVRVLDRVAAVTRFLEHNLLEPPPEGNFDLILCRNVLVYFSPEAGRLAVAHLVSALAPGGVLIFGAMDLREPVPQLATVDLPELQIHRRPASAKEKNAASPAAKGASPKLSPKLSSKPEPHPPSPLQRPGTRPPEPVALHLKALVHIERGDRELADRELAALNALVPDYVPGLLERALLHQRLGERSAASALMRQVLQRISQLQRDELLAGPEPLPVGFYRDSAETFLRTGRGD